MLKVAQTSLSVTGFAMILNYAVGFEVVYARQLDDAVVRCHSASLHCCTFVQPLSDHWSDGLLVDANEADAISKPTLRVEKSKNMFVTHWVKR